MFVWEKRVQLIWLRAELSSLHISLQTNPSQPEVSEVKHTIDINFCKTLLAYVSEMFFVITNVHILCMKIPRTVKIKGEINTLTATVHESVDSSVCFVVEGEFTAS